jgi:glycosyltransferase 2 family protein
MNKYLKLLIRLLLVAGCLVYIFWGLDIPKFFSALQNFRLGPIAAAQLIMVVGMIPPAFRLRFLTGKRLNAHSSLKAMMLGWGLNNLLPVKLGEIAKAFYIKQYGAMPLSAGLGLIFWERFFDLNMVLLLGLFSATLFTLKITFAPLIVLVAGFWLFLIVLLVRPSLTDVLLRIIPFQSVRVFSTDLLAYLRTCFQPSFFFGLVGYTVLVWFGYSLTTCVVVWWVAGFDLTLGQVLVVFTLSSLGMGIPSAPGSIGVFEAAMVFSLSLFGVEKEAALAAALVLHFIEFLPTTLGGLLVMAGINLNLETLRHIRKTDHGLTLTRKE